jgi:cell division protein FtsQ
VNSRWRLVRGTEDAVPDSVRRFSQRIRRRRLRAALPWLVGLGVAVALAGAFAVVWATPLLGVSEVRVDGAAKLVTPAAVRAAAGVPSGTPLARLDLDEVASRVGALPPVERATVTRQWPHGLRIRVVERTPVAAVARMDGYAVVDRSGVVFDSVASPPRGLPMLKLASPGGNDPTTRAALTVLSALSPGLRAATARIAADAPTRIRLELRDERQIIWGDATQSDAKVRVATMMLRGGDKVMDVSAPTVVTTK